MSVIPSSSVEWGWCHESDYKNLLDERCKKSSRSKRYGIFDDKDIKFTDQDVVNLWGINPHFVTEYGRLIVVVSKN